MHLLSREVQSLEQDTATDTVWIDGEPLPPRFVDYVTEGPAKSLRTNEQLVAYLSSTQASHISDTQILRAQASVDDIKRLVRRVDGETNRNQLSIDIHAKLDELKRSVISTTWGSSLQGLISRLEQDATALATTDPNVEPPPIAEWAQGFRVRLDRLDRDLANLREAYSLRTP